MSEPTETGRHAVIHDWQDDPWDDPAVLPEVTLERFRPPRSVPKMIGFFVLLLLVVGLLIAGGVGFWVVRQVNPAKGTALVQDINISKRHMKPTGNARQAGIVDKEQPIQLSNLALVDPKTSKPTRVRMRQLANGTKVRIAIASGEQMARE